MKVILSFPDHSIDDSHTKRLTIDMESEQEIVSPFSTLNVNAVEFVPSFGAVAVKEPEPAPEESAKPVMETPENNGNGESCTNCRR